MRVISLVYEHAEELAEFLDARAIPYYRVRGKWADLFEWDRHIGIDVSGLRLISIDLDELAFQKDEAKRTRWEALHLADEASRAEEHGQADAARLFYKAAYDYARIAAERFATHIAASRGDCEPLRSLLYATAADLAIKAGYPHEAECLIATGLAGSPSSEVANELYWLRSKFEQHK